VASILHPTTTQTYNKHMKVRNADSVLLISLTLGLTPQECQTSSASWS